MIGKVEKNGLEWSHETAIPDPRGQRSLLSIVCGMCKGIQRSTDKKKGGAIKFKVKTFEAISCDMFKQNKWHELDQCNLQHLVKSHLT